MILITGHGHVVLQSEAVLCDSLPVSNDLIWMIWIMWLHDAEEIFHRYARRKCIMGFQSLRGTPSDPWTFIPLGLSMKSACLVSICYHVLIKFRLYILGDHQGHARKLPYKLEIFKEFLYTFETNIHRSSGKYNIKYIRESSILKIAISKVVFLADRCLGNHLQRYF